MRTHVRLLTFIALASALNAQESGFLSGVVRDRSGDPVTAADVRIQSDATGARQIVFTDAAGNYMTPELTPGNFKITVRRDGFRTVSKEDVVVAAGKIAHADFTIDILPLQQEVSVTASQSDVDPTASGLTMSRSAPAESLPQNGRDVHALFTIMPGATVTPASISAGGQFSVSGQRPNTNSFRVDGINANVGVGIVSAPGAYPGDTLPGMSSIGGMQSLASKEETETVKLRSADFDPQFGDRPGAQVNITTRSGTQDFHGSLFGYFRPSALNSADWFTHEAGLSLQKSSLSGWGGALGGPLWRKRTFFFVAAERADVHDRALQLIAVPSLAARANPLLRPYQLLFDAFPVPTGRSLNAYESLSYSLLNKDAAVTNRSIRVDHTINPRLQLFGRFSDVPSTATSIELGTAYSAFGWRSSTAGATLIHGALIQDLRANYTNVSANSQHGPHDAPAVDAISHALSNDFQGPWALTSVSMSGVGSTFSGEATHGYEHQFAGSYLVSKQVGRNAMRAGLDYVRLQSNNPASGQLTGWTTAGSAVYYSFFANLSIVSPSIESLLAATPLGITGSFGAFPISAENRYSSFATDTFRMSDRLNLLFGVRWDMTPQPNRDLGSPAFFTISSWGGAGSPSVPITQNANTSFSTTNWFANYTQLAPRVGLAYHLNSPNLVLRAGAGLFYDTGLWSVVANTNPLAIWQYQPKTAAPTLSTGAAPLTYYSVSLPRVWEWKAALEKSLGENSLVSLSYFGSSGSRLLRSEASVDPASGILESLNFTTRGHSAYQSLSANVRANFRSDLYALVSYTWGHSIDMGSSDTSPILADGPSNKASSSFDVRHLLTASLGYRSPAKLGRILGGWTLSSSSLVRSGFPFDVTTADQSIGLGFENADHASIVPGQPLWILGSTLPGGRALNPAAFQTPVPGAQGTLARNALTGPAFFQIDTSLRRQIRLYRGSSVEACLSAFNLLNHPSFANPVNYLGSALFGQSTSMTNLMLGSGSPTTGLTPLFQAGGPRTIELSLRFSF